MTSLTKAGTPRIRAEGGGRKPNPIKKVKMECYVLPKTKEAIGPKAGKTLDEAVEKGLFL